MKNSFVPSSVIKPSCPENAQALQLFLARLDREGVCIKFENTRLDWTACAVMRDQYILGKWYSYMICFNPKYYDEYHYCLESTLCHEYAHILQFQKPDYHERQAIRTQWCIEELTKWLRNEYYTDELGARLFKLFKFKGYYKPGYTYKHAETRIQELIIHDSDRYCTMIERYRLHG